MSERWCCLSVAPPSHTCVSFCARERGALPNVYFVGPLRPKRVSKRDSSFQGGVSAFQQFSDFLALAQWLLGRLVGGQSMAARMIQTESGPVANAASVCTCNQLGLSSKHASKCGVINAHVVPLVEQ